MKRNVRFTVLIPAFFSLSLSILSLDCPSILELHSRFVALYHSGQLKIDVFSFVETALTLMSVLYLRIVGIDSAGMVTRLECRHGLNHINGDVFIWQILASERSVEFIWIIGKYVNHAVGTAFSIRSWSR